MQPDDLDYLDDQWEEFCEDYYDEPGYSLPDDDPFWDEDFPEEDWDDDSYDQWEE